MKKIYFIYAIIPEKIYNEKIKYIISNIHDFRWKHGNMYGLYAWSTSKKIIKEFFEVREKSMYTLVKKDIYDEEEIEKMRKTYTELELKRRQYYFDKTQDKKESLLIVSTKNEFVQSTEFYEENLYEFGPPIEKIANYSVFKDKIIKALDKIGYVGAYDQLYGTESDVDLCLYNKGFGLTKYGYKDISLNGYNQMNVLLYLFRYFFYGNELIVEEE